MVFIIRHVEFSSSGVCVCFVVTLFVVFPSGSAGIVSMACPLSSSRRISGVGPQSISSVRSGTFGSTVVASCSWLSLLRYFFPRQLFPLLCRLGRKSHLFLPVGHPRLWPFWCPRWMLLAVPGDLLCMLF